MEEIKYNQRDHDRQSLRLPSYNYSFPGEYFVTICTNDKKCIFGDIINGKVNLNQFGYIVKKCILDLQNRFKSVRLLSYIVMPNHLHVIIRMQNRQNDVGAQFIAPQVFAQRGVINHAPTVGMIIRALKARSTHNIHSFDPNIIIWQRNYYERIIRSDDELFDTIEYIKNNPKRWLNDYN